MTASHVKRTASGLRVADERQAFRNRLSVSKSCARLLDRREVSIEILPSDVLEFLEADVETLGIVQHLLEAFGAQRKRVVGLAALRPGAHVSELGDPLQLLPDEVALTSRREVAGLFGEAFADRVLGLPLDRWAGPVESGYGLHLVLVTQRTPGRLPSLAEVRERVVRDVLAARRAQRLEAMYRRLLERHPVVVAPPISTPAARAAAR